MAKQLFTGLNEAARAVHMNAVNHGWWDKPREAGTVLALIHSEISEALEELREPREQIYYLDSSPHGVAVELADCIIRILDYCARDDIDIERALQEKHDYNIRRPYRHGNKEF